MPETARKPTEPTAPREWVTLNAAAQMAKCSRLTLVQEALAGQLVTDRRAGLTFVERESLMAFIARREAARKEKGRKQSKAHR